MAATLVPCRGRRPAAVAVVLGLAVSAAAASPAGAITPTEMQPHRRTVADIDRVGNAVVAWLVDQTSLGAPSARIGGATVDVDVTDYPPAVPALALEAVLVPDYIDGVPELDGWGNAYEYRFDETVPSLAHVALIRSRGSDGAFEGTVYTPGRTSSLAEDLVWADALEIRGPGPTLLDLVTRQVGNGRDTRVIGAAILLWITDRAGLAPPGAAPPAATPGTIDLDLFTQIAVADVEDLLVPRYLPFLPPADQWGNPFDLYLDVDHLLEPEVTAIRSRGRDGIAEGSVYPIGPFDGLEFERDEVWADGLFAREADASALIFVDDFEIGDARFWSAWSP